MLGLVSQVYFSRRVMTTWVDQEALLLKHLLVVIKDNFADLPLKAESIGMIKS